MAIDETLPAEPVTGSAATPETWDRYELGERLGEGGMGVVYKARDRRLDRVVAIKFIRGDNPTLAMRLVREARAQARIDHPGVCHVYEVGEVGGRAYIALQFVAGQPLATAAEAMALDEKVAVFRDICFAVHEAHRLGIVHRDLKPSNVLVERGEDGRAQPIVMDFGLARETTIEIGLTQTGMLMGTPAYMSPEQARGELVDRRSDVYSLGATLYELLAKRPPFTAESLATALDLVINHEPPAPRSLVPTLPVDLETITLKCLSKDPTRRYPTARALADDLTRYLDGEPILGRRTTLRQRLRTSIRKHRALWALSALSSIAVLGVGAVSVRSYVVERADRARSVERTELATRLGRDAKDIELLLHTAYQLPLHDTRRERELVRTRMQAIAATHHDLGPLGDAVIHDALGRGHLALH
jgi:serine/threonine-protein kinase